MDKVSSMSDAYEGDGGKMGNALTGNTGKIGNNMLEESDSQNDYNLETLAVRSRDKSFKSSLRDNVVMEDIVMDDIVDEMATKVC